MTYTIKENGIKFNIVVTKHEIVFIDERGERLSWANTEANADLVDDMVYGLIMGI